MTPGETPHIGLDLGHAEIAAISEGRIETAELFPLTELEYPNVSGVFPLEQEGKRNPKKAENLYSDYKCFTL